MAMECPEFWRIEGNVKRHLRRLRSINNAGFDRADSSFKEISFHKDKIKKMNSKALKKQGDEDEDIRQMIKHNLEYGGTEDIIDVIRRNQEVEADEDEIGLYDHVYDSSDSEKRRKKRKKRKKNQVQKALKAKAKENHKEMDDSELNLSNIDEAEDEDENQSYIKRNTGSRKMTGKGDALESKLSKASGKSSKLDRRDFPKIGVSKMSTLHIDTAKNIQQLESSKIVKPTKVAKPDKK